MLLVQDYLLTHTIGDLAKDHGVYAHFNKSGYKASFSYDQIEAVDSNPIAQECRGLILAGKSGQVFQPKAVNSRSNYDHVVMGETRILAFPFRRFFNESQGAAAKIDFTDPTTKIQMKHDGTLCIAHYDPFANIWCVATRSVPEADLPLDNFGEYTFRTLFDRAFKETMGVEFTEAALGFEKHITYMFELTTPYNRIVCQYNNFRITLLGARDLRTLQEIDVQFDEAILPPPEKQIPNTSYRVNSIPCNLPRVKTYSLQSAADIIKWVNDLNPLDEHGEGVVVCDKAFNRVKIKNAKHGLLSKAKDKLGSSMRNCLELALSGKEDDFVSVLPDEIVQRVMECKEGVRKLIHDIDETYATILAEYNHEMSQKEFALAVQTSGVWQAPMFKRFAGKVKNTREYIESCKKDGTWSSSFLGVLLELIEKGKANDQR